MGIDCSYDILLWDAHLPRMLVNQFRVRFRIYKLMILLYILFANPRALIEFEITITKGAFE